MVSSFHLFRETQSFVFSIFYVWSLLDHICLGHMTLIFFKGCFSQILLGPFLNIMTHISTNGTKNAFLRHSPYYSEETTTYRTNRIYFKLFSLFFKYLEIMSKYNFFQHIFRLFGSDQTINQAIKFFHLNFYYC